MSVEKTKITVTVRGKLPSVWSRLCRHPTRLTKNRRSRVNNTEALKGKTSSCTSANPCVTASVVTLVRSMIAMEKASV